MKKFKFRIYWTERYDADVEIEAETEEEAREKLDPRAKIDEVSEAGATRYGGLDLESFELLE
jgi:hypothetical protein